MRVSPPRQYEHACWHPRYGFTPKRKPTSGLSFSTMRLLHSSSKTESVAGGGSPSHSTWVEDHGFGGLLTGRTRCLYVVRVHVSSRILAIRPRIRRQSPSATAAARLGRLED